MVAHIGKCLVEHKDKYYVYVLSRPNGQPFYIGKGQGQRVNDHFKPYRLKEDSLKNRVIFKHGADNCKREILRYFENETEAYLYEEELINHYGIIYEGGILANLLKGQKNFPQHHCEASSRSRRSISDEMINKILDLYLTQGRSRAEIVAELKLTQSQVSSVIYNKRVCLKEIKDGYENLRQPPEPIKPDSIFIDAHKEWLTGTKTVRQLAKEIDVSKTYLDSVFQGQKRKYLNFPKVKPVHYRRRRGVRDKYLKVRVMLLNNISATTIMKETGIAKTSLYRLKREIEAENLATNLRDT